MRIKALFNVININLITSYHCFPNITEYDLMFGPDLDSRLWESPVLFSCRVAVLISCA